MILPLWSVDEWYSEISTSLGREKVDGRLDDLQTNGLDIITKCVGRITGGEMERNDPPREYVHT